MKLKNKIKIQLDKNKIQLIKQQVSQHIEKGKVRNVAEQVKTRGVYKQASLVKGFLGARQKRGLCGNIFSRVYDLKFYYTIPVSYTHLTLPTKA